MKYINKILSLFVIALIATSCDPDAESYTPGEQEDGNQGICFVGNYTQTVEDEPAITSFDLTLTRALTDAVGTVDVTVINNEENIFVWIGILVSRFMSVPKGIINGKCNVFFLASF